MAQKSSASKIAKMAQKGKGRKVRFQNGTMFPAIVALVCVLGVLLIAYSRSVSYASAPGPKASKLDHYHIAYGIYQCDTFVPNFSGIKAEAPRYQALGVHSHDDGVIHYHPRSGAASGRNAKLKRFLEVYDVELTNTRLTLPADQGGLVLEEGVTKCTVDGKEVEGQLKVAVWDDSNVPDQVNLLTANMDDARVTRNGMAMVIAFVPEGVPVPLPPTATNLAELGAVDGGDVIDPSASTVPGAVVVTVPGEATTIAGAPAATEAPAGSAAPSATEAPGTTGG